MDAKLLFLQALSPLHAGTGQGVGVIDLPIAREQATNIPFLPGSSLKGVFRDACDSASRTDVFGPDTNNAELHAGAVNFTDARLFLLPVRSLHGVFAWVTSPLILRRFVRDAQDVQGVSPPTQIPTPPSGDETCYISDEEAAIKMTSGDENQVVIEDLPHTAEYSSEAANWAEWLGEALFTGDEEWRKTLKDRFCVVSDDTFSFLLETATEITARIRLDEEKKTVERGALWYEEALPAETVLVGLVVAAPVKASKKQVFETIEGLSASTLQFGGNATVGRGLCKAQLIPEAEK